MKPETVYGFRCGRRDEKVLIQRVNAHLAEIHRTTSKAKNPDMLKRYLPSVIKYFYWNLNKDTGTWLDIYPNEDVNARWFFPDRTDFGWLMRVRIDTSTFPASTQEKAEQFIGGLLAAVGYETVVLHEADAL